MNVFLTGATGAIGRRLVPMLVKEGHKIVAMTREFSQRCCQQVAAFGRSRYDSRACGDGSRRLSETARLGPWQEPATNIR